MPLAPHRRPVRCLRGSVSRVRGQAHDRQGALEALEWFNCNNEPFDAPDALADSVEQEPVELGYGRVGEDGRLAKEQ